MRISDWSSDVCSSDLGRLGHGNILIGAGGALHVIKLAWGTRVSCGACGGRTAPPARAPAPAIRRRQPAPGVGGRAEERRGGRECVRPCGSRWSPCRLKKKYSNYNLLFSIYLFL